MRRGFDVRWIYPVSADTRLDQENNVPNGVRTTPLPMPVSKLLWFLPTPKAIYDLSEMGQKIKPKVTIFNGFVDYFIPLQLSMPGKRTQVFHGDIESTKVIPGIRGVARHLIRLVRKPAIHGALKQMNEVIAVSNFIKERLKEKGWIDNATVCYPPTRIDNCEHRHTTRQQLNGKLVASIVSRISPEKGIEYALSLARNALTHNLPYKFNFVGPAHHRSYLEEIRQGRPDNTEFVGAKIGPDLCRTYSDSDILLMPSPSEGFGLVLMEAMHHGLPVLARGNPAAKEIFNWFGDQTPGHLSPFHENESIPDAVMYLDAYATRPDLRTAASTAALGVKKYYDPEKQTNKFVDLILS